MNTIILLIFGIVIAPVFSGTAVFDGPCPTADVEVLKNFDPVKFEEYWYVIERYEVSECNSCTRYDYMGWNEELRLYTQVFMQKGRDPEFPTSVTTEWVQSKLEEKVHNSNDGAYILERNVRTQNYHFVDTDYVNYAVLWTCLEGILTDTHEQNLVVMARDKFFDINSLESLNATLAKTPFNRSLLRPINHTDIICQNDAV